MNVKDLPKSELLGERDVIMNALLPGGFEKSSPSQQRHPPTLSYELLFIMLQEAGDYYSTPKNSPTSIISHMQNDVQVFSTTPTTNKSNVHPQKTG